MLQLLTSFLPGIWSAILVILVFILTWHLYQRITTTLPPGPTPLPLVGNSLLPKWYSMQPYEYFQWITSKYGKIMTFYFGPVAVIVLNTFEATKEAYVNLQNDFAGRPWMMAGDIMVEGDNDIGLADFGAEWSIRRRLAMVALKKIGDKTTVAKLVCESVNDSCEDMVNETIKNGKTVQMKPKIQLMLYNVIACLVFSEKFKSNDKDFKMLIRATNQVNDIFGAGFVADLIPILKHIPTPRMSKLRHVGNELWQYFDKQIADHKDTINEDNARDITDALLIAATEYDKTQANNTPVINHVQLRSILMDVFMGGTDTTAFTIYWCLLYAIVHPDLQEKVFAEIDANIGAKMVMPEDRFKLPYTEAFLLEVMRSRPIAPLSMLRTTTTNTELYGYQIPKGTRVLSNIWASHHDPKYWPEPDEFRPERFIDTQSGKVNIKPDGFMSFSMGRRSCAGEHLARIDTFLILATLIQKVKFSLPEGDQAPDMSPCHENGVFFIVPNPYNVKAVSR